MPETPRHYPTPEEIGEPSKDQLELVGLTPEQFAELDPKGQYQARAAISDKISKRRASDPEKGHKKIAPHDLSGPTPEVQPVTGAIAPKLAGERAKALSVLGRVRGFIDKYSKMAVDRFGGYSGGTIPGAKGGGEGRGQLQQMMSKERAMKLVEQLPMMPTSQMMSTVRMLGNYVWNVHRTARKDLRDATIQRLAVQGKTQQRKHYNPQTGEYEERPYYDVEKDPKTGQEKLGKMRMDKGVDTDAPSFKAALAATSREFETDSVQIKADLNMLASAAGALKRAGGFGGQADKEFLQMVGGWKKREVVPKEPEAPLPPELSKLAGDYPRQVPKSQRGKTQAKGPTIHKAQVHQVPSAPVRTDLPDELPPDWIKDHVEHRLREAIEVACADRQPHWLDDI